MSNIFDIIHTHPTKVQVRLIIKVSVFKYPKSIDFFKSMFYNRSRGYEPRSGSASAICYPSHFGTKTRNVNEMYSIFLNNRFIIEGISRNDVYTSFLRGENFVFRG